MSMKPETRSLPANVARGGNARHTRYLRELDFHAARERPPGADPSVGGSKPEAMIAGVNDIPFSIARQHVERYGFATPAQREVARVRHETRHRPVDPGVTAVTVVSKHQDAATWTRADAQQAHTDRLQRVKPSAADGAAAARAIPPAGGVSRSKETAADAARGSTAERLFGHEGPVARTSPQGEGSSRAPAVDTASRVLGAPFVESPAPRGASSTAPRARVSTDMPAAGKRADVRIPLIDPLGGSRFGVARFVPTGQ